MKAYRAPTSASVIYMLQLKNGERKGDSLTQQRSAVPFLIGEPVGKNVREESRKEEKVKEKLRVGQIDQGQDNRSALRDRTTVLHPQRGQKYAERRNKEPKTTS